MKTAYKIMMGLMLFLALTPSVYADGLYPSFGPQTYELHKYYYFGDSNYSAGSSQGLNFSVDSSSVSYQSVKGTLTMDYNIINDRHITKFIILANGINVDEFEPYFDYALSPPVYKEYYYLDVNVSNQYIGSDVFFQVIGLSKDLNSLSNVYVTSWSSQTPTIKMKPLPVIDRDAILVLGDILSKLDDFKQANTALLQQILDKLEEMKLSLVAKLDEVKQSVEKIYTVTPETQAKFDLAIDNFQTKLPNEQVKDDINNVKDMLDNSATQISNTPQKLAFGQFNWMGAVSTHLIDFSELVDQIALLRKIMQITLWCEFFYGVIMILRPRFTV